jgi:hypothetical protein
VEEAPGKSDPVMEGAGRKGADERHPPGVDARTAGALLGIDRKGADEAHRLEPLFGRSHLFGGVAERAAGKGTAWRKRLESRIPLWRELVGRAQTKGIRLELLFGGSTPYRLESSVRGNPVVMATSLRPMAALVQRGEDPARSGDQKQGRLSEAATAGLPEVARGREPWCDETGATRDRSTGGVVQAQRTPNASCDAFAGAVVATSPVPTSCG